MSLPLSMTPSLQMCLYWIYLPLPLPLPLPLYHCRCATAAVPLPLPLPLLLCHTTPRTIHRRGSHEQHTTHTYTSRSLRLRHRRKRQVSQPTKADAAETWMFLGKAGREG